MALEKRTVKNIAIVVTSLVVVVILLGVLIGLLQRSDNIELQPLQVWPRGADGSPHPLISYQSRSHNSVETWVQQIDDFLSVYRSHDFDNRAPCSFVTWPGGNLVCDVDLREFHPCTAENQYNYRNAAPCVFLKLDKIVDWTPINYIITEELPESMPYALKREINFNDGRPEANVVWVSCDGVDPIDKEHIGPVKYIPHQGFPDYYFPYTNQKGYLSPLVAVQFERPGHGIVINVECKAWAKNIACKDCEPSASVRFQLLIE